MDIERELETNSENRFEVGFENQASNIDQKPGFSSGISDDYAGEFAGAVRARSSLRQRYEAEAKVMERRLGSLEDIREKLGLSQRKIAQLLLVDPSAWTRWTSDDGPGAPPHVWRALTWYLALQEKFPALDAAFWLHAVARAGGDQAAQTAAMEASIAATRAHSSELESLRKEVEVLKRRVALYQDGGSGGSAAAVRGASVPGAGTNGLSTKVGEGGKSDATRGAEETSALAGLENLVDDRETRAIARIFLLLTFLGLGYVIARML